MAPPWANALLELQTLDRRLQNLHTRLELLPKEKKRIADAKKKIDARLDVYRNDIRQQELLVRQAESEIASLEESIRKNQQQSSLVKKNTEYQAMLAATEMSRKRIGDLESLILEKFDAMEKLKTALQENTAAAQKSIKMLKKEWMEFEAAEKDIKSEQLKLTEERQKMRQSLPAGIGGEYDNLFKSGDGEPLAAVEEGGICGHCFLKLTPQTLNKALSGAVARCDSCFHLIYMTDAQ